MDESKDDSKKEQISVIVSFLNQVSEEVHEEFLHHTTADGLDTDGQCNIELHFCVGEVENNLKSILDKYIYIFRVD